MRLWDNLKSKVSNLLRLRNKESQEDFIKISIKNNRINAEFGIYDVDTFLYCITYFSSNEFLIKLLGNVVVYLAKEGYKEQALAVCKKIEQLSGPIVPPDLYGATKEDIDDEV